MAIETIFQPTVTPWEGVGINCKVDDVATITNQMQGMHAQWCRFFIEVDDPGPDGIYFDDDTFERLWENSENIQSQTARFTYATFEVTGTKFIFTARGAPQSWLTNDGTNELRGDALVAFARMFAAGVATYAKYGMPVTWVEICDEPSTTNGTFITPENYVILLRTFKSFLTVRNITRVKVMGPGLSCIVPRFQSLEPYIDAFKNTSGILDAWSVHVIENKVDADFFNAGTFSARNYVRTQLQQTIRFMNWTLPSLPVYITKFATSASRYSQGIDYGHGAPESVEYAIRLMDNVCGIVSSGASSALSWFLTFKYDNKSLFRQDGSKRPQRDALALLNKSLPTHGRIFVPNDPVVDSSTDQTLKAFVASRNSFGFVLSRSHLADGLNGELTMRVKNTDWRSLEFLSTMTLSCFPTYVSLSGIQKQVQVQDGDLVLKFSQLPFNCVIFGKGDVYASPPLLLPPTPLTNFDIPRVSDLTNLTNINEGDIVYHVQSKSLLTFCGGTWKAARVHTGVASVLPVDD